MSSKLVICHSIRNYPRPLWLETAIIIYDLTASVDLESGSGLARQFWLTGSHDIIVEMSARAVAVKA